MEQKRFLTAGEVFQLFGVDADSLESLVESGAVKALPDRGSVKYRSEDFVALVNSGKLSPRTSGEMFQVDSKGDIPFLKVNNDDFGLKFDDEVSFLELDEEALSEQANAGSSGSPTPNLPENWFEDSDDSIVVPTASDKPGKAPSSLKKPGLDDEETDFELNIVPGKGRTPDSDSDVQIVDEDSILEFDEPDVHPAGSDSDVRLEGPVSSSASPAVGRRKKPDSDSDVRLSRPLKAAGSDSDVTVVTDRQSSARSPGKKAESDSGVQRVSPSKSHVTGADSDSDVVLVASPVESGRKSPSKPVAGKKPDSDSDVRLSESIAEVPMAASIDADSGDSDIRLESEDGSKSPRVSFDHFFNDSVIDDEGSAIRLSKVESGMALEKAFDDSGVTLESSNPGSNLSHESAGETQEIDILDSGITLDSSDFDSGIKLEAAFPDSGVALHSVQQDAGATQEIDILGSGITLDSSDFDSGIKLEAAVPDSGVALHSVQQDDGATQEIEILDSGITLDSSSGADSDFMFGSALPESGVILESEISGDGPTLEIEIPDSGISLEPVATGSAIHLESAEPDSGISLEPDNADSGISLEMDVPDSGISLEPVNADSGIALEPVAADSDVSLDFLQADSGISLEAEKPDSGITLEKDDSGIRVEASDSGITFEDDVFEPAATLSEDDDGDFELMSDDEMDLDGGTQTLSLSSEHALDSGFDVSLADPEQTTELRFDGASSGEIDVVKGRGRAALPSQALSLSEAFKLDEPLEVEDLDISEDLDAASGGFSDEFAEVDEDVLEASDADFSDAEAVSVDEGDEFSDSEVVAPVAKTRAGPREPAWGMLAVAPIIGASVFMMATVMILWGGIATMWTGAEAPGPAGMLISTLAGLIGS